MGGGIVAMHYTGMAAMRMPATVTYNPVIFALSVVIAIVVAVVALLLAFHLRADTIRAWDWRKVASSVVMGGAIPAMHYTGMAAAHFAATGGVGNVEHAIAISALGTAAIVGSTFLVLMLALGDFHARPTPVGQRSPARKELTIARDGAEAANRAKSSFLANMSHEISTR